LYNINAITLCYIWYMNVLRIKRWFFFQFTAGTFHSQKTKICTDSDMSRDKPDVDGQECTYNLNSWSSFGHDDK
jgi:hypothetical protein